MRGGDHARVAADQAGPRRLGAGVVRGRGQRVRAHVADLPGARGAGQLHQLVADRDHRHPRLGVHQHLVPAGRGEQRHLGGADHPVPANGQVTGLHVLADPAHERGRRHALLAPAAGRCRRRCSRSGPPRRPAWATARRPPPAPPARAAAAAAGGTRPGSRRPPAGSPASRGRPRSGRRCAPRSRRWRPGRTPAAARDATTSSAQRRPCASEIATRTGAGLIAVPRIRSSCSSTDRTGVTPSGWRLAGAAGRFERGCTRPDRRGDGRAEARRAAAPPLTSSVMAGKPNGAVACGGDGSRGTTRPDSSGVDPRHRAEDQSRVAGSADSRPVARCRPTCGPAMARAARGGGGPAGRARPAGRCAPTCPIGTEPGSAELPEALRAAGHEVLLPVVPAEPGPLDWARYDGPERARAGTDRAARADRAAARAGGHRAAPGWCWCRRWPSTGAGCGSARAPATTTVRCRWPTPGVPLVAVLYDEELVDRLPAEAHDFRITAALRPDRDVDYRSGNTD